MLDRREIVGYAIVHRDGDRPYYCHRLPDDYKAERGSRVFRFVLPLPDDPHSRLGVGITEVDITQAKVLADIADERERQDKKFPRDYPDGTGDVGAAAAETLKALCTRTTEEGTCTFAQVLAEEAAEALVETDPEVLRHELVQTAAVCVKWIESLDRRRLAR